jgi:hypothetical protein
MNIRLSDYQRLKNCSIELYSIDYECKGVSELVSDVHRSSL